MANRLREKRREEKKRKEEEEEKRREEKEIKVWNLLETFVWILVWILVWGFGIPLFVYNPCLELLFGWVLVLN